MQCPNCGNETQDDAVFCDQCGTRLSQAEEVIGAPVAAVNAAASGATTPTIEAPTNRCPNCGTANTPGEMFCSECGTRLAAPQPEPAAIAERPSGVAAVAPNTCPDCGAQLAPSDEFCYACGTDLRQRATEAAAAPLVAPAPTPAEVGAPSLPYSPVPLECPACGAEVLPGDAFCEFCGAALTSGAVSPETSTPVAATAQPAATPAEAPAPAPETPPLVSPSRPRLVIPESGVELPLASGSETLVGREDPYSSVFPDIDLTPHGGEQGGVSRRHFKITLSAGQYLIEDLNSTNSTMLNHRRLQPGVRVALSDGDEIRAGRVRLIFRAAS